MAVRLIITFPLLPGKAKGFRVRDLEAMLMGESRPASAGGAGRPG